MANEHIKTAAMNLQRAVQDVRDAQKRLHGEIDNVKRENARKIEAINRHISQLEVKRIRKNFPSTGRVDIVAEERTLQSQISIINRDTELYAAQREQEINMFEGQANHFQSLANQLNTIA